MIAYNSLQMIIIIVVTEDDHHSRVAKFQLNSNLPAYFHWFFVAICVYAAFSYPAIYTEVCCIISIICAEYRSLNDDFASDTNTYQLPVIRHYVTAHRTMLQSQALFRRSLRYKLLQNFS